jgi:hypothetical protein
MTLSEIQEVCLTKLCYNATEPGWSHIAALKIEAFRSGNQVVVRDEDASTYRLTAEEFRTFMAYRVLWGYLEEPTSLIQALKDASGFTLVRNETASPFSSELAQASSDGFYVEALDETT